MPVSPLLVPFLRDKGHEAVHASSIALSTAADAAILDVARQQGRVVITADLDYPRLLAITGADTPGVILFRGGSYSENEMRSLLERVLAGSAEADLERSITVVDSFRIRRRSLPAK